MPDFPELDNEQLATARNGRTQAEFNQWFDSSPIKAGHKKACMEAQEMRCCYCHKLQDTTNNNLWDLEHVLDESGYPQFFAEPLNLAVACKRCNGAKSNKDVLCPDFERPPASLPSEASAYTIPHPWLTVWTSHVKHVDYLVYTGITNEGKTLVNVCGLNKPALEQARLPPDSIETAVATDFFEIMGPHLAGNPSRDAVLRLSAQIIERAEKRRADVHLRALRSRQASGAGRAPSRRRNPA
jgi:hypothetical protein